VTGSPGATVRRHAHTPDAVALRGAWWALRAVVAAHRQLRARPLDAVRLPAPPPGLTAAGERGVYAALRRLKPSCFERALVLQRWLAYRGEFRAVVIGVTAEGRGFSAHAWLEGEQAPDYEEIARVAP
jgi:Transglutaminase-like superfamily